MGGIVTSKRLIITVKTATIPRLMVWIQDSQRPRAFGGFFNNFRDTLDHPSQFLLAQAELWRPKPIPFS
jgi:hypothetical protein